MNTENGDRTEGSWKLSDWLVGGYVVLLLVPAWVYLGYVVLVPARAEVREPVKIAATFEAGEAAYIQQSGKGVIEGRIFARLWSGEEVPCSGKPVRLVPNTALSRERLGHLYGRATSPGLRRHVTNPVRLEAPDPRYWDYMGEAYCDETGRFRFEGVADGEYFVVGSLVWGGPQDGTAVSLMQPASVRDGERVELLMTPGGSL